MKELSKYFDFENSEKTIRQRWEAAGLFKSKNEGEKNEEPYSILMPPPNVTGILHFGHVLNHTLQDIFIRRKRMEGYDVCWFPGLDHAGIATQARVEKELAKDNITRHDLGREKFIEKVYEWKEQYGGIIIDQLKRLGNSSAWDKLLFTMEGKPSSAVKSVFINLFDQGLIYKGNRIINWSPASQTAISDEEVEFREVKGKFYTLKYKISGTEDFLLVSTVRPETIYGDVAIAVNPEDKRYSHLIGKKAIVPVVGREITIIGDSYADPEFGTGCVKITPAHDPNDYEIGIRHGLDMPNTINPDGTMNLLAGVLNGLDRFEAREKIVDLLDKERLLQEVKDYQHNVGYSQRGGEQIEPYLSEQWFVKMKPLAEIAIKALKDSEVTFYPKHWEKTYYHWMDNIKDWCISRQLWWGHQIPVYYSPDGRYTAAHSESEAREKLELSESIQLKIEEDVLDTWFSSWLWPMTTMGWDGDNLPTDDTEKFLPTDLLITGPDIIFFWVARMVMSSKKFSGKIPFKDVYFTSMIRDGKGKKLSKSLGNSPDPLNIFDKYGVDAVRFTMIYLAPLGQDVRMDVDVEQQDIPSIEIGRNFINKLWNASRFIQSRTNDIEGANLINNLNEWITANQSTLDIEDEWILTRLKETKAEVAKSLEGYKVSDYSKQIYNFVWTEFCGWYIEAFKISFGKENQNLIQKARLAKTVLAETLKLLHPVIPYVTEEIWENISDYGKMLCFARPQDFDIDFQSGFDSIIKSVDEIRKVRGEVQGVPPSQKLDILIKPNPDYTNIVGENLDLISKLSKSNSIKVVDGFGEMLSVKGVSLIGEINIPMGDLIDTGAEIEKLQEEIARIEGQLKGINSKLSNDRFVNNAPENVVTMERKKQSDMTLKVEQLRLSIDKLKD
ncbi:MAG: valine--tRNA ligase [Candidatus Kapaibacteriales bacterium]